MYWRIVSRCCSRSRSPACRSDCRMAPTVSSRFSRRRVALTSPPSSHGNAVGASSAFARASTGSPAPSRGLRIACRQTSIPLTARARNSRGNTPARTSDDLPLPLMPSTRTNGRAAAACRCRRSSMSLIAAVRPKKIASCCRSKISRPRNGDSCQAGSRGASCDESSSASMSLVRSSSSDCLNSSTLA